MVSLWPFGGEDNSPASFEKTLSTLSTKITRATSRLDLHRQHARRFKALWTLYTSFIYLLYTVILALVLGWQNWGVKEYAAILGGPVIIYAVRAVGSKYFEYRINNTNRYLDSLQKQRDETIEKLKVATKYNSTQQLLEKYAGDSPKQGQGRSKNGDQKPKSEGKRKTSGQQQQQQQQPPVQRTGLPPPPTANIRRPAPPQPELPPSPYPPQQQQQQQFEKPLPPPPPGLDEPGFAPNAFPASQQYIEQSHWYDRLLDVLLGEDETQPKNRIVLICSSCRLVNGQAPPGMKTLEELGRWRCGGCGAWNGEESAAKKALADIKAESGPVEAVSDAEADVEHPSSVSGTDDGVIVTKEEGQDQIETGSSSGAETPNEEAGDEQDDEEEVQPEPVPVPAPKTRSQNATRRRGRKG
ncbi:hypothetical protein ASPVEDRAFT_140942 [Aspergillus versicolor CBS 583.65]|uniref:Endoplasmic reticulum junction formation protein lunapark n=1 Tax=Aspergillus versicolor CBS 583.65 TaxID=1036611 RepID=A0A1L9PYP3_ASPVE|nr:uncharacterized protein ASPVEDRAFT_140942 [Aspergillus versicolor CBS 583.65]OJJ06659.1 hypothetical protein ASPVEDRAFT_140942 [Aspergillus versicolor CBS 583.65]